MARKSNPVAAMALLIVAAIIALNAGRISLLLSPSVDRWVKGNLKTTQEAAQQPESR